MDIEEIFIVGHRNTCLYGLEGSANLCIPLLVPKSSTEGIAVAALHMHFILHEMLSTICSASWGALLRLQWIDLYCSLGYFTTWNDIGPDIVLYWQQRSMKTNREALDTLHTLYFIYIPVWKGNERRGYNYWVEHPLLTYIFLITAEPVHKFKRFIADLIWIGVPIICGLPQIHISCTFWPTFSMNPVDISRMWLMPCHTINAFHFCMNGKSENIYGPRLSNWRLMPALNISSLI